DGRSQRVRATCSQCRDRCRGGGHRALRDMGSRGARGARPGVVDRARPHSLGAPTATLRRYSRMARAAQSYHAATPQEPAAEEQTMSAFYDKVKKNCNKDDGTNPITCSSQTHYDSSDTADAPAGVTDLVSWLQTEAVRACRDYCGRKSQVN